MRKKFIDKIYMKEVKDKIWYIEKDEKSNTYIALKYIKEIEKPLDLWLGSWDCKDMQMSTTFLHC